MSLLTITSAPAPFSWSKNPVEFRLLYTGQLTGDLVLQFSVNMADESSLSGFTSVYTGTVRFNADGYTFVDIQRILDAQLEYLVAQPWDTDVNPDTHLIFDKQCRKYRVGFQVIYAASLGGSIPEIAQSQELYVAKGGVQFEQFDRDAVYNFYFGETQKFLNYHNNDVFFTSQGYLFPSFIATQDYEAEEFAFCIDYFFDDNSQTTVVIDLNPGIKGDMYTVPVPLYNQPGCYKIRYRLAYGSSNISELITVYLDYRLFNFTKFFAYINSLGGTEWMAIPFNQVKATNVNSTLFSRFANAAPSAYNMVIDTQNFQSNFTEQLLQTMDSGELSIKQLDHLRQLMLSPACFELMTAGHIEQRLKYIPATVTANAQGSLSTPGNQPAGQQPLLDNIGRMPIPLRIQVARAFNNFSYTPDDSGTRQVIDASCFAGVGTAIGGYFYMVVDPSVMPVIIISTDANGLFFDYGDNYKQEVLNVTAYEWYDLNLKLVTIGYKVGSLMTTFIISDSFTNVKELRNIPQFIRILSFNNQLFTEYPVLPVKLQQLHAAFNQLSETPPMLASLQYIDLRYNRITTVSEYSVPAGIEQLYLNGNRLSVSDVNFYLIGINNLGTSNGTLWLDTQTPAAPPSGAAVAAKAALIARGWNVVTD